MKMVPKGEIASVRFRDFDGDDDTIEEVLKAIDENTGIMPVASGNRRHYYLVEPPDD